MPDMCLPLHAAGEDVYSALDPSMALNQADKEEVRRIVENRKGFALWAKESIAFSIVTAGAIWIISTYVPEKITSQTSGMSSDVAVLKNDVGTIKNDLSEMRKDIKEQLSKALDGARQELQKSSKKTVGPQIGLELGDRVLQMARTLNVRLDEADLSQYGESVINAAFATNRNPDRLATQAVARVLDYRSYLNNAVAPNMDGATPYTLLLARRSTVSTPESNDNTDYIYYIVGGRDNPPPGLTVLAFSIDEAHRHWVPNDVIPMLSLLGSFSNSPGAAVEPIASHLTDLWGEVSRDAAYRKPATYARQMVVQARPGTKVILDGLSFRNVVFRNSSIRYDGGPLILDNVLFVDCTFTFEKVPGATRFAKAIAGSTFTHFRY
jgi:hypothetical protein